MSKAEPMHTTTVLILRRHPRRSDHPAIVNSNGEVLATFGMNETRKQIAAAIAAGGYVLNDDNTVTKAPEPGIDCSGLDRPISGISDAVTVAVCAHKAACDLEDVVRGTTDTSWQAERLSRAVARIAVFLAGEAETQIRTDSDGDFLRWDAEGPSIRDTRVIAKPLIRFHEMQQKLGQIASNIGDIITDAPAKLSRSDLRKFHDQFEFVLYELRQASEVLEFACRQLDCESRPRTAVKRSFALSEGVSA